MSIHPSSTAPASRPTTETPLAAILAGGASSRFGSPKALAMLGGLRVIDHVRRAVESLEVPTVLIANDTDLFASVGLPVRMDAIEGAGPLAGIHAALAWARDEGRPGALCVACDMPLVPPALLRRIVETGMGTSGYAVAPASPSRAGIEPLCAYYPVEATGVIETLLNSGSRRAADVVTCVDTVILPLDTVREFGDPEAMFLNVNTPEDLRRAERIMGERREGA